MLTCGQIVLFNQLWLVLHESPWSGVQGLQSFKAFKELKTTGRKNKVGLAISWILPECSSEVLHADQMGSVKPDFLGSSTSVIHLPTSYVRTKWLRCV